MFTHLSVKCREWWTNHANYHAQLTIINIVIAWHLYDNWHIWSFAAGKYRKQSDPITCRATHSDFHNTMTSTSCAPLKLLQKDYVSAISSSTWESNLMQRVYVFHCNFFRFYAVFLFFVSVACQRNEKKWYRCECLHFGALQSAVLRKVHKWYWCAVENGKS